MSDKLVVHGVPGSVVSCDEHIGRQEHGCEKPFECL